LPDDASCSTTPATRRLSTSYFLLDLAQETDLADHDLSPKGFFQYVEHLTGRLAARWPQLTYPHNPSSPHAVTQRGSDIGWWLGGNARRNSLNEQTILRRQVKEEPW
jgi:hypothetical protein